jgi:hypothetical protein
MTVCFSSDKAEYTLELPTGGPRVAGVCSGDQCERLVSERASVRRGTLLLVGGQTLVLFDPTQYRSKAWIARALVIGTPLLMQLPLLWAGGRKGVGRRFTRFGSFAVAIACAIGGLLQLRLAASDLAATDAYLFNVWASQLVGVAIGVAWQLARAHGQPEGWLATLQERSKALRAIGARALDRLPAKLIGVPRGVAWLAPWTIGAAMLVVGREGPLGRAVPLLVPFVLPWMVARNARQVRRSTDAKRGGLLFAVITMGVMIACWAVELRILRRIMIEQSSPPLPQLALVLIVIAGLAWFAEPDLLPVLIGAAMWLAVLAATDAGAALVFTPVVAGVVAVVMALPAIDFRPARGRENLRMLAGLPTAVGLMAAPAMPLFALPQLGELVGASRVEPRLRLAEAPGYFDDGAWLERVRLMASGVAPDRWIPNAQSDAALFASRALLGPLHQIYCLAFAAIVVALGLGAADAFVAWRSVRSPARVSERGLLPMLLAIATVICLLSFGAVHLLIAKADWFPVTGVPMPFLGFSVTQQVLLVAACLIAFIEISELKLEAARRSS